MTEITNSANFAINQIGGLDQSEQVEISPVGSLEALDYLTLDNLAPDHFIPGHFTPGHFTPGHLTHSSGPILPVYVRQVRQAQLMEGLTRLLADIYGDRSETPITLSDLMHRLNVDSVVVAALARSEGQPIANKLLDRLSHRLALTPEGHKQFQILTLLYGLGGYQPRTAGQIAALAAMPLKDVKHLFIMMRCRLESEQIKTFVEETLKLLVKEFIQSPMYNQIVTSESGGEMTDTFDLPAQHQAIKDLEKLADELVESLDRVPTINVCGQAGTGKTSLALKVTARLLQKGQRVLYVSHSRFFAQHIQSLTRFYPGDLTVSTFHALCHHFAKQAGVAIPSYRNNKVFNELFPELLIAAMHSKSELAFDAIVVDEGHALLPNFWRALKFCLKDLHRGSFIYFYDPTIMSMAKNKAAPFAASTANLTRELRPNFNLVAIKGGVEVYEAISKEETSQAVSKVVTDLLAQQIRPDEMTILSADTVPKVSENRCSLPRGVKLAATPGSRDKHILYTSLSSFRAMTKRVVILTLGREVEDLAAWKLKYLSYSAFSRAGQKLILIGNLSAIEKIMPSGVEIINPESFDPQLRRQ